MTRAWIVLAALSAVACSTHTVAECFPPCGMADQAFFARCVANGLPGGCEAGNRRCCALAAECVGPLDDQTVETTRTDCHFLVEEQCWPACGPDDVSGFDLCVGMGSASCAIGGDECCALEADCLGTLGDLVVSADGCCSDVDDCAAGERCDAAGLCAPGPGCGDRVRDAGESCDDGNAVTETCGYGPVSCVVCTGTCVAQPGTARYCGDGVVESAEGEACDPPDDELCDAECQIIPPSLCFNGAHDGAETDVDCGGGECAACAPGLGCEIPQDCAVTLPECNATVMCGSTLTCVETVGCDDGDDCTRDRCFPAEACVSTAIDDDADTFGPRDLGCGLDCDDGDPLIAPGMREICDAVDQDCDDIVDERCTST